jgi:hypothetical protein
MTGLFTVKEVKAALAVNVSWYAINYCTTPSFTRSSNTESPNEISKALAPTESQTIETTTMETELSVIAMPNPSHNDFTLIIKSDDVKTLVTVRIMDMYGKVISQQKTTAGSNLKIGNVRWSSGNYVAEIMQGERRKLVRLVKL